MADQQQRNAAEVKAREYFQIEWPTAWHRLLQKYCGDAVVTLASRFAIQYAAEQVEKQALQFNDARSAMKEAYQQGTKDGVAAERTRIGEELDELKRVFRRNIAQHENSPFARLNGYEKEAAEVEHFTKGLKRGLEILEYGDSKLRGNDNDGK